MKFFGKKVVSIALAALLITLIVVPASAVTAPTTVKNSSSRSTTETALSAQAEAYYQDEVKDISGYKTADSGYSGVYQTFCQLANKESNITSNSYTAAQGNSLFNALYDIMSSTHTHAVSYPSYGKNSLAHYWLTTDTSNVNYEDGRGAYTFFYSDVTCINNDKMQREHIWPKSHASFHMKTGLGGSDLHHLRPAYGPINLAKLNYAFGNVKGQGYNNITVHKDSLGNNALWRHIYYQNKIKKGYIDVKDDVRGDVARILLYVYTRWKQPNLYSDITTTDSDGNTIPDTTRLPELDDEKDNKNTGEKVIESLPVLLQWMKDDPVSKWEMQRNDLTEDIQGNRNVFIDYPELAWLLFDQTVPSDMDTPSGMAKNTGVDIDKFSEQSFDNPVTLNFQETVNSGEARITAYNNTTNKPVKNGGTVERGDSITYTITPDDSTITYIRQYNGKNNKQLYKPDIDTEYSFTKEAGYYTDTECDEEKIKTTLVSKVCKIIYNISGKTASGGDGGSGSGMVTAIYKDDEGKIKTVDNEGTVPNGKEVTFTFTPDYGSHYIGFTINNQTKTATKIDKTSDYPYNTESYIYKETLSATESTREKKINVKFGANFAYNDSKYISNKGMRPDADDTWGGNLDFNSNFEICGAQIKTDKSNSENKALRFISVVDKKILEKAESYGYLIGYTKQSSNKDLINRNSYSLVYDSVKDINDSGTGSKNGIRVDCTNTENTSFGNYGLKDTETNYKYITAVINNIQSATSINDDTVIIVRPYVKLDPDYVRDGAPSVIYGQYIDFSTGEAFCACSGSYNAILAASAS